MELFPWKKEYEVSIREIDNQHQGLVQLINDLHNAMRTGKAGDVLSGIFDKLIEYTQTHFLYEEQLMQKYKYPDFAAHKEIHDRFITRIQELKANFEKTKFGVSVDVMQFLKDWLVEHIAGSDQKYAPYLLEKGIK